MRIPHVSLSIKFCAILPALLATAISSHAADLTWRGSTNNWTTANAWSNGSSNATFSGGDNVWLTDAGLANASINVSSNVTTGTMTANNTSGNYLVVVSGGMSLTGTTLTKSGEGTLTFSQTNNVTFTNTDLRGGTLILRQTSFKGGAISVTGTVAVGMYTSGATTLNGTTLTGNGELTVVPYQAGAHFSIDADTSGFTGTIKASSPGFLNLTSLSYDLADAKVSLSGSASIQGRATSSTIKIGQITTESGNVLGKAVNGGTITYEIGALNTASHIAGTIQDFGTQTNGNPVTTGNVALTKVGSGVLVLSGANTYTGATAVTAGTLLIDGNQSAANGTITVSSGAVVGGNGTAGGNLILESGALLAFDTSSTLTLNGTLTLDSSFGVASLRTSSGGAIDWSSIANSTYTLLSGANLPEFNASNISNFGLENAYDIGGGRLAYFENGSLQLTVVPEPSTLALFAAGVACAAFLARGGRQRKC